MGLSSTEPFATPSALAEGEDSRVSIINERLSLLSFSQLSGTLGGYPFVKVVVDRELGRTHFLRAKAYEFHADYIGEQLMGISRAEVDQRLDALNKVFYQAPESERRFLLGIIALHKRDDRRFFTLETVEVDTMGESLLREFFNSVKRLLDPSVPVLLKPANHQQETMVSAIPQGELPRVLAHELFSSARYIPLNVGTTRGRIRAFRTEAEYRSAFATLEWHDVLVMHRVPDDIPRLSGIINAHHTTPLSHTNVLASGWGIPNCIQLGIFEKVDREGLNGRWVEYSVSANSETIQLELLRDPPKDVQSSRPAWSVQKVQLEEPETTNVPIVNLDQLRMSDRYRYGTKAANLGELSHLLSQGSGRVLGFYRVPRPPRANLLPYLAHFLGVPEHEALDRGPELGRAATRFLRENLRVPRGIAIPFSVQQEFLESSPRIQQMIGKLKMALELNAREVDALCLSLQALIRSTRMSEGLRNRIDEQIAAHLSGVSSFVVRSSSNAEDLENFSAAGIYESINHCATAEKIFESIKEVWASLLSARSVRLRQQVGISLDASYMGVIVQEEMPSKLGGVLVTTNPLQQAGDFRNVFVNVSPKSAVQVVGGTELPIQYLFNTVEGGGRTLSVGDAGEDLSEEQKTLLQRLAFAGRLLQSHFSPDYRFSQPVDIEWLVDEQGLVLLQLRPYARG